MDPIIRLENVSFSYKINEKTKVSVLKNISLSIFPGEYVAIIGHNGSGKSTLSKLLNGILTPDHGEVWVHGHNTKDTNKKRAIRQAVGMVFQHPDNQIVATIVEEDVAFGLENIGVPREEMKKRVDEALNVVKMSPFRHRPPHHLSGGQKQRVAIAGVLAMQPECIVFDEATSMLDSFGRKEVIQVMRQMNNMGMTIITVTHHMSEAAEAGRIIVVEDGEIVMDGTPREIFKHKQELEALKLEVPSVSQMAEVIHRQFADFSRDIIHEHEFIGEVEEFLSGGVGS
ncbi:energy-coupling factor transporter ATPase [Neobacillus sp. OS1-32]|jgi:energy-coupling factor transport system ATP-binding protein|uniref:Energy-coupling factor transporter ATPase n=1 Tax=Neobacillus paridis TaxID=2803862 RepID=A0ABS1TP22_9BACI|nr:MULTISPECIES: energy-coupling factor transporter ATPase [Neobacillus]MBL4952774.1 energy-coupling factor transporter ATPase [Neobacillus paridis]WML31701.1 energy-coupling factor transporter ATPase [Neobacillus sp. OS1-32]